MKLLRYLLSIGIIALALGGPIAAARAADVPPAPPPAPAPAVKDEQGFEKVDGSMMKGESIPASRLVSIAYGVIFAAVAVYAFGVARRTQRVESELADLKSRVERAGGGK
jgi:predicted cobalt transporter CbtA